MEFVVNITILILMTVVALGVVKLHSLFAGAMLFGVYSLLAASLFVVLDAVDVAFTEAAVGAGISTILILATLTKTSTRQESIPDRTFIPLLLTISVGALMIYATIDLPSFGDALAPAHQHVAPRYIGDSGIEIGIPNIVTSVLASYRGYDTLGEVTVIYTAGIGVLSLLGSRGRENHFG